MKMMFSDFACFVRHCYLLLHFVRGVMLYLVVILCGCAVWLSYAEGLNFGEAFYFALLAGMIGGNVDYSPSSVSGRIASVVAGCTGLIIAGVFVGVATRGLHDAINEKRGEGTLP